MKPTLSEQAALERMYDRKVPATALADLRAQTGVDHADAATKLERAKTLLDQLNALLGNARNEFRRTRCPSAWQEYTIRYSDWAKQQAVVIDLLAKQQVM